MIIKEYFLIVDRGGAVYVGESGHGYKPPVSIHISRGCVMNCPFQWYVEVEILIVLLGLVQNYGCHEAFTTSLGKDK